MKAIFVMMFLVFCTAHFANSQNWQTDFETAKSIAASENKRLIMVFQGSDWCAACIKLDREIWSNEAFIAFANDSLVMLKVDFPRRKANALSPEQQAKNSKLAALYNKQGFFPLVVVMNKTGRVLGETGYKPISPQEYIGHLSSFK
jgi:thioredoxin-related protein